jgi:hypothetical protein
MSVDKALLKPGDVLVVGGKGGIGAELIRERSRLEGQPDLHNHVAMFTHFDIAGEPRGLEGRPGGFGWANVTRYITNVSCMSNAGKSVHSDEECHSAVELGRQMISIPYDWEAIIAFGYELISHRFIPTEWPEEGIPSHVVCSSAIDLIYEHLHWDNPGGWRKTRGTDIDDWTTWLLTGHF